MRNNGFLGQSEQDKFVLNILKYKKNGFFLEIGANDPINISNTYLLENKYDWKGIMIEYDVIFLPLYEKNRPNSVYVINDATKIDYKDLFIANNVPFSLDYLQIDLEANNGSTIRTLQKLDDEIFDSYKFAVVTFEHDIYHTNFENTREKSREIFLKRGYFCVFKDINNNDYPYEDWYVHPDLVDMNYINKLVEINNQYYTFHNITGQTINYMNIKY